MDVKVRGFGRVEYQKTRSCLCYTCASTTNPLNYGTCLTSSTVCNAGVALVSGCYSTSGGLCNCATGKSTSPKNSNTYFGGVYAPNGNIYFAPFDARGIGMLNPKTGHFKNLDVFTTTDDAIWQGGKFSKPAVIPGNKIVFPPLRLKFIGVLNLDTHTFDTLDISSTAYNQKEWHYCAATLGPNQKVCACICPHCRSLNSNPNLLIGLFYSRWSKLWY